MMSEHLAIFLGPVDVLLFPFINLIKMQLSLQCRYPLFHGHSILVLPVLPRLASWLAPGGALSTLVVKAPGIRFRLVLSAVIISHVDQRDLVVASDAL